MESIMMASCPSRSLLKRVDGSVIVLTCDEVNLINYDDCWSTCKIYSRYSCKTVRSTQDILVRKK